MEAETAEVGVGHCEPPGQMNEVNKSSSVMSVNRLNRTTVRPGLARHRLLLWGLFVQERVRRDQREIKRSDEIDNDFVCLLSGGVSENKTRRQDSGKASNGAFHSRVLF